MELLAVVAMVVKVMVYGSVFGGCSSDDGSSCRGDVQCCGMVIFNAVVW